VLKIKKKSQTLPLTMTAIMIQTGIQRISERTMTVPTMFARMNITAHTHTWKYTLAVH